MPLTDISMELPGALADRRDDRFKEALAAFSDLHPFREAGAEEIISIGNPFRRPMRGKDHFSMDFTAPLTVNDVAGNKSLAANRLLFNLYETELLFLPGVDGGRVPGAVWDDFNTFYDPHTAALAGTIRGTLERCAFGFLDDEVRVSGRWTAADVRDYLQNYQRAAHTITDTTLAAILDLPNRADCVRFHLVQMACDFLTEASAMARNVPGNAGELTSALFRILIDEYGYGVHRTRHSTLFENLLRSTGLEADVHAYWQFYMPTSLLLTNYFHYLTRNKQLYFRYLGALYYTESSLVSITGGQSLHLREVFGDGVDTTYFDEHHHIDRHHGNMAFDSLIEPVLERHEERAASEIVRGFEEFRLLESIAAQAEQAQLRWAADPEHAAAQGREIRQRIVRGEFATRRETFREHCGERSTTHVHDDTRLLVIERGEMQFWSGVGGARTLRPGDVLLIPAHCLHGSAVTSGECLYHQPLVPDWHLSS